MKPDWSTSPVSPHARLLDLVRRHLSSPSVRDQLDAEGCLSCLSGVPPEDVPDDPRVDRLARAFIIAFAREDPAGLPPGLASHLADWLAVPADPRPFLAAWASSRSVAEVAFQLKTNPDDVLFQAHGLRQRGVEVPDAPGGVID